MHALACLCKAPATQVNLERRKGERLRDARWHRARFPDDQLQMLQYRYSPPSSRPYFGVVMLTGYLAASLGLQVRLSSSYARSRPLVQLAHARVPPRPKLSSVGWAYLNCSSALWDLYTMEKSGTQWSVSSLSPTRGFRVASEGYGGYKTLEPRLDMQKRERLDRYGGKNPSVSLNNNNTAVVVNTSSMGNSMWYWVGRMDDETEKILWADGRHFDYGVSPSVSLKDSGLVVEAHRSQWTHELKCTIGKVDGDFIEWGKPCTYANGTQASIVVNNSDTIVEVHVNDDRHIDYKVGEVSTRSIQWSSSSELGTGTAPHVAINDSNTVVVVYRSSSGHGLMCQIGVTNKMALYWGRSIEYASGLNGGVSLASNNRLVILRQGLWLDEVLYGVAKVSPRARELIEEGNVEKCRSRRLCEHKVPKHFVKGSSNTYWHPSVSINNLGKVLTVYGGMNGKNGRVLWYQFGSIDEPEDEEDPPSYHGSDDEKYLSEPSDEC